MHHFLTDRDQSNMIRSLLYLSMRISEVNYIVDYRLQIKFEDGAAGEIDLVELVEKGVFQPLKDRKLFSKVYSTGSSIAWSDELEIDANTLYAEVTGKPIA